jgi:hypothetical protein
VSIEHAAGQLNTGDGARRVCAMARDILGGNGILLDHLVARHHADIEAVLHLRGHRLHSVPDRRTRDHRPQRLPMSTTQRTVRGPTKGKNYRLRLTSSRTSSPNQNSSKMRVRRESLSIRSAAAKAYHLMARLRVASPALRSLVARHACRIAVGHQRRCPTTSASPRAAVT